MEKKKRLHLHFSVVYKSSNLRQMSREKYSTQATAKNKKKKIANDSRRNIYTISGA